MKKTNFIVMAMLLMGLAFFVNMDTASAATSVYVNVTSGNDAYDGSQFYISGTNIGPKRTISAGVNAVDVNGTVNIANGVYRSTGNTGITISKNMIIKGQSTDNTIINGSDTSKIFTISSGVNVTLLNLTIADGKAYRSNGGAVTNNGGTLTINNCTFNSNSATLNNRDEYGFGGAIYNTGTLNVIGSTFKSNTAEADGGAIYNTGTATIASSSFTNNLVTGTYGGAIYNGGTLTVTSSNFTNNTGYDGGAISHGTTLLVPSGALTIINSNFTRNIATSAGGAIWSHGTSSIANSLFSSNSAITSGGSSKGDGGAIRNWGNMNLTESIFTNNTATISGDAISNYQGILNATFNEFISNGDNDINVENNGATSSVIANNNWWGSNSGPTGTRFTAAWGASAISTSWLTLSISTPTHVFTGSNSTILVYLTYNSNGTNTSSTGTVPDGTMITLTSSLGSITSSASTINGTATVTFNAGIIPGLATIYATVNGYTGNATINIVSLANLEINQTVNTPVNVGDKVTFLVTATNKGPNTATNINIRDIIPSGLTGVVVTPSVGTYNSTTGIWTIPSLLNGSSAVLNITGTASALMAGKITNNTATEISQTQNSTQLPSSTKGVYTKLAEVEFHQTVTSPVNVGGLVTYIVYVTNYGPDIVTYTVIEDFIPSGLLNATATPSAGTYSNGLWTINFLDVGQTITLTIRGIAGPTMAGKNTTNTATKVAEREYDPTTLGESTSADAYTNDVNLVITNTANSPRLNVNQAGIFTVTVTNNGPDAATNIQINDLLPEGFTPSWDMGDYDGSVWTIANLPSGETATLILTCDLIYDALAGTNIVNQASGTLEEYPFNFSAEDAIIHVNMANVVITQTGSYSKNNVTFIITVRNNGPDNATNVNIMDLIPNGLKNVTFTPSIGTYNDGTGVWFISNLVNGEIATLTIKGNTTAPLTIINIVNMTQDEYSYGNVQSTFGVYVPAVDLYVRNYAWFTGRGEVYSFNEAPPYVSAVTNYGPDDATNIVVKYAIGKGLVYSGCLLWYGVDRAVYDGENLTYYINYLPKNGTAAIIVYLRVNATGNKTADLTTRASLVSVDQYELGASTPYKPNSESRRLIVDNASDIQVTQNSIVYDVLNKKAIITIHVHNNGPSNASGVLISDLLPNGLVYNGHTSGQSYDNNSGIWNVGTLLNNATKTLQIFVNVTTSSKNITNYANLNATTLFDWNTTNNGQVANITLSGNYNSTVDLYVRNYAWFTGRGEVYSFNEAPPYVSAVTNYGPDDATNIVVKYAIGKGLVYSGCLLWYGVDRAVYDGENLTYYINYLPKNGTAAIIVYLRVNATGNKTADLTTRASLVSVDQYELGASTPYKPNSESRRLIVDNASDIQVTQNIDGFNSTQAKVGQEVTLTLTVKNNGPSTNSNITVNDVLSGLNILNDGGATYDSVSGNLIWTIDTLNPGESKTIHIVVCAEDLGTYTIYAIKTASSNPNDWNSANNAQTNYIVATEREIGPV